MAMFLAVVLAAREWSGLGKFQVVHNVALYFLLSLACLVLWFNRDLAVVVYASSVVSWIIVVPLLLWHRVPMRADAVAVLGGILVLVPLWLAMVQLQENPALMLALLAIVWISDSAAYGVGRAIGRHKLAASISPGKTWEGVGGAFFAISAYAMIFHVFWYPSFSLAYLLGAFFAVAALGILGDLFESLLKRGANVKDSGTLLPGHGGVLDRIDALTAAIPLAALLFPPI
jgi:phosphatidate cytidylyltransferase